MTDTTTNTITAKDDDRTVARTVTMYPDQWSIVEEINEKFDFRNVSTALRYIVNDYNRIRTQAGKFEAA